MGFEKASFQLCNSVADKTITIIIFLVATRCTIKDLIKDPESGQKVVTDPANHDFYDYDHDYDDYDYDDYDYYDELNCLGLLSV